MNPSNTILPVMSVPQDASVAEVEQWPHLERDLHHLHPLNNWNALSSISVLTTTMMTTTLLSFNPAVDIKNRSGNNRLQSRSLFWSNP